MTYYLIDFENVHEDGFAGAEKLGAQERIVCLFTRNTPRITMSTLARCRAEVSFLESPTGKDTLDLALGSWLGYLMGQGSEGEKYVIISRDSAFFRLAEFWNRRLGYQTVSVAPTIAASRSGGRSSADRPAAGKTPNQTAGQTAARQAAVNPPAPKQPSPDQNPQKQRAANQGGGKPASGGQSSANPPANQNIVNPPASQNSANPPASQDAVTPSGTSQGAANPPLAPAADQAAAPQAPAPQSAGHPVPTAESTAEADKLRDVFAAEGFDAPTLEAALALVEANRQRKNVKQVVYLAMVKKHGQKKGTKLYNLVKKHLLK